MRLRSPVLAATVLCLGLGAFAAEQAPLRVCMLSGSWEYKSHETLPILKKHLEANYHVRCAIVQAERKTGDNLPGMEALDEADVMVVFMRRQKLKGEQLARFKAWCEAGKPIVGIRTASHAVQTWLEFDKLVLGGNYRGHYGGGVDCKVVFTDEGRSHPILKSVEPFVSKGSLYRNTGLAAKDILMVGEAGGNREPVTWTNSYKGGRIFYTSLGHPDDFRDPNFLRLLANAVHWVASRDPQPKPGD